MFSIGMKRLPGSCSGSGGWICKSAIRLICFIALATTLTITCASTTVETASQSAAVILPSSLPVQREVDSSFASGNISGVMVVCAILLGALLFYVRVVLNRRKRFETGNPRKGALWSKWLGNRGSEGLQVVSSKPLSSHSRLHVVEWNGSRYLIAQNEHAFALLDKVAGGEGDGIAAVSSTSEPRGIQ